jgi:hypothetical protein
MIKNLLTVIFFFAAISVSLAQEVTFDKVKQQFENGKDDEVIKNSDRLITEHTLSDSLMIEIHLMRALVFYTTGKDSSIKKSFESILEIKNNYVPDPLVISSRLIPIFEEVRSDYFKKHPDLVIPPDLIPKEQAQAVNQEISKIAVAGNFLLPGIGQLHKGESVKGMITTAASLLNLGAVFYFTSDASRKQSDYLNETNKALIQGKYDDYNKSYKLRNTFIITYAAIWVFSQIDFLFSSDQQESKENVQLNSFINLNPSKDDFQLGVRLPLRF